MVLLTHGDRVRSDAVHRAAEGDLAFGASGGGRDGEAEQAVRVRRLASVLNVQYALLGRVPPQLRPWVAAVRLARRAVIDARTAAGDSGFVVVRWKKKEERLRVEFTARQSQAH